MLVSNSAKIYLVHIELFSKYLHDVLLFSFIKLYIGNYGSSTK